MDFNSDGFYLTGKFIGQRTYQKQDGTHGLNIDILQKIENRNYVRNCFGNLVDLDLADLKENQKGERANSNISQRPIVLWTKTRIETHHP